MSKSINDLIHMKQIKITIFSVIITALVLLFLYAVSFDRNMRGWTEQIMSFHPLYIILSAAIPSFLLSLLSFKEMRNVKVAVISIALVTINLLTILFVVVVLAFGLMF
ncbi:hypothetical protein AZF04_12995 [Alkalihalobacillus trypoxylicola]|uniref:Uncharacterized protein n=2 Tax=Alkalihalobacillus trypoxylicola TaxID=519424 RepID=A0A161PDH3_9BACI|nr:hypothetical protein AZF04_12995 [Alkalihalobacillus trypoxylicola]